MSTTQFQPTSFIVFPYVICHRAGNARKYRVRIQLHEDADPSTITVKSDFSLRDLIDHIRSQDCDVLAIRRGKGAWHNLNRL